MIPFLDVKAAYTELAIPIEEAIRRVLTSGRYVLGAEVENFEREFATWVGADHCVGMANGLDAIALALRAVGVGPGDEVIVPSHTYIATWLAVTMVGATIVPVEPDLMTNNLDPNRVEAAITLRTKALLPVHLYGHPADMVALAEIATRRGLRLIEDAAQAHGAAIGATRIGHHGDAVAWSFYPGKNLGAVGDGGAVTTDDPDIARRLSMLRNYGSATKYINEVQGVNSRLDPIQAAVLRAKLPYLAAWNARRERIAEIYANSLASTALSLPATAPEMTHAWHLYVVKHDRRDHLQYALRERGVETLIHYPIAPFRQSAYETMKGNSFHFPIAQQFSAQVLSLPIGPHLSEKDAYTIVAAVHDSLEALEIAPTQQT